MTRELSRGVIFGVAAAFLFSCGNGLIAAFSHQIPTNQILFIQNGIAFIFLLSIVGKNRFFEERPSYIGLYTFRGLVGFGSTFLFACSLKYLDVVDATLLNMSAPFFMVLLGMVWLKERPSHFIWPVLFLGFYGTSLICPPSSNISTKGVWFAFISGLLSALALTSVRKLNQKNESPIKIALVLLLFGAVLNGSMSAFNWQSMSQLEWQLALGSGLCLSLNQFCLSLAYRWTNATTLAPIAYSVIPFTMIINALFYSSAMGLPEILGAALIFLSGILAHRISLKRSLA